MAACLAPALARSVHPKSLPHPCLPRGADLGSLSVRSLCQLTRSLATGGMGYHQEACDAVAAAVAQLPDKALDGEVRGAW